MKNRYFIIKPAVAACLVFAACGFASETMHPVAPRCEYHVDPQGIDVPQPRLSWRLEPERAQLQNAHSGGRFAGDVDARGGRLEHHTVAVRLKM